MSRIKETGRGSFQDRLPSIRNSRRNLEPIFASYGTPKESTDPLGLSPIQRKYFDLVSADRPPSYKDVVDQIWPGRENYQQESLFSNVASNVKKKIAAVDLAVVRLGEKGDSRYTVAKIGQEAEVRKRYTKEENTNPGSFRIAEEVKVAIKDANIATRSTGNSLWGDKPPGNLSTRQVEFLRQKGIQRGIWQIENVQELIKLLPSFIVAEAMALGDTDQNGEPPKANGERSTLTDDRLRPVVPIDATGFTRVPLPPAEPNTSRTGFASRPRYSSPLFRVSGPTISENGAQPTKIELPIPKIDQEKQEALILQFTAGEPLSVPEANQLFRDAIQAGLVMNKDVAKRLLVNTPEFRRDLTVRTELPATARILKDDVRVVVRGPKADDIEVHWMGKPIEEVTKAEQFLHDPTTLHVWASLLNSTRLLLGEMGYKPSQETIDEWGRIIELTKDEAQPINPIATLEELATTLGSMTRYQLENLKNGENASLVKSLGQSPHLILNRLIAEVKKILAT